MVTNFFIKYFSNAICNSNPICAHSATFLVVYEVFTSVNMCDVTNAEESKNLQCGLLLFWFVCALFAESIEQNNKMCKCDIYNRPL